MADRGGTWKARDWTEQRLCLTEERGLGRGWQSAGDFQCNRHGGYHTNAVTTWAVTFVSQTSVCDAVMSSKQGI